jgi:hypothetical protein
VPLGQDRVCDWAELLFDDAQPMEWPETLKTRSKSSDLHLGHLSST